jgi:hypothetical protein
MVEYLRTNPVARAFYRIAEGANISFAGTGDMLFIADVEFVDVMTDRTVETHNVSFLRPTQETMHINPNRFSITIPKGYRSHGRTGDIFVRTPGAPGQGGASGSPEYWAGTEGGIIGVVSISKTFVGEGTSAKPFVVNNAIEYDAMLNEMYQQIRNNNLSWGSDVYFISHNNISDSFNYESASHFTNESTLFVQSHVFLQVGNQTMMFGSPYSTGSGPRQPFPIYRLVLPYGYTYNGFDTILVKYVYEGDSEPSEERLRELALFMFDIPEDTLYPIVSYGDTITVRQPSSGSSGGGGGGGAQPTVTPTPTPMPVGGIGHFRDVNPSDWFYDDVKFVVENGLFSGVWEDSFEPATAMTRAMMITVLARYAGIDTTGGAEWWSRAIEWGVKNGLTDGENLNDNITREQIVTLLWRYAEEPIGTGDLSSFIDASDVSDWAIESMNWALGAELIRGRDDGALDPRGSATRAEVAAILHKFAK